MCVRSYMHVSAFVCASMLVHMCVYVRVCVLCAGVCTHYPGVHRRGPAAHRGGKRDPGTSFILLFFKIAIPTPR